MDTIASLSRVTLPGPLKGEYRMKRRMILAFLMTCALVIVGAPASSYAAAPTNVVIAGSVNGALPAPCNCPVTVYVSIVASGVPTSLSGSGVAHASTGATNRFDVAGSVVGGTATLAGTILNSTAWYLVGTPIVVVADTASGSISYTMGPITAGPFRGKTLTFVGDGTVLVNAG